jgi:hypothetical protein
VTDCAVVDTVDIIGVLVSFNVEMVRNWKHPLHQTIDRIHQTKNKYENSDDFGNESHLEFRKASCALIINGSQLKFLEQIR